MDPGAIAPAYIITGTITVAIWELLSMEFVDPVPMKLIMVTAWAPVLLGAARWWKKSGD